MKEMGKGCKPCATSALFKGFGCGLSHSFSHAFYL